MIAFLLESVGVWIKNVISTFGYPGIVFTMAIESALIPLPSEIIMPFSGYLVSVGRFSLLGVSIAGAIGNLLGSLVAYGIGYWGGETFVRGFIRRWGKWILLSEKEFNHSTEQFNKYGNIIIFVSRLLPGIRTVISLPAGVAKVSLKKFIVYTTLGSLIWSFFLAFLGVKMGEHWTVLKDYFHKFDAVIGILIVVVFAVYVYLKVFKKRKS